MKQLSEVCEEFKVYPDLKPLAEILLRQLTVLISVFEEQKVIITNSVQTLQVKLVEIKERPVETDLSLENTIDSTSSMPIEEIPIHTEIKKDEIVTEEVLPTGVHIETQTGRSLSSPLVEEPLNKDFSVSYNVPVDAQIQTNISSSDTEPQQSKETITISKKLSGGQETIQIATKPMAEQQQPIIEEPDDDLLVEANYRKRPESETKITELNITNTKPNQPFETVFVEPDETTTEVIVDADGTKRIIVKKLHRTVVRHQQSVQQSHLTTLSTLTHVDGEPVTQSFSQVTLQGQQSSTTIAKGDGRKETLTSQQYGGKIVSGAQGGEINVHEFQSEPETQYTVIGEAFKPDEVDLGGIKLHEGDVTFVDNQSNKLLPVGESQVTFEGSEIHTSSSSVRAVVQQVTRRIIRKTRRIIRKTVIIDGKEHVTEEVVEEPEEVEVTEEGIPRVSINVTRTEDGKIVQEQQFGEPVQVEEPSVTVTRQVTSVLLDSEGKPIENVPEQTSVTEVVEEKPVGTVPEKASVTEIVEEKPIENIPEQISITEVVEEKPIEIAEVEKTKESPEKTVSQTDERYVETVTAPDIIKSQIETPIQTSTTASKVIISDFIENERLAGSPVDSSTIEKAPSVDAAPKRKKGKGKKTPKTPEPVAVEQSDFNSTDYQNVPTNGYQKATEMERLQTTEEFKPFVQEFISKEIEDARRKSFDLEPISLKPAELVEVVQTKEVITKDPTKNVEITLSLEETKILESPEKHEVKIEESKQTEPAQAVEIVLSLEEKQPDVNVETPKVSVSMKIEENKDKNIPAEVLQKEIHVVLPSTIKAETETTSPIVPKHESEYKVPSTPSDIDHGGRGSKKKKKHKDSVSPEEIKPHSNVSSSLAESIEISVADSKPSEQTPLPTEENFEAIETEEESESEKGKDTGYEADKTTVDESLADDDDQEKKKRRKKKRKQKVKVKESEESNVPKSISESSAIGESVPLTDDEVKVEVSKVEEVKKSKKKRKGKRKQSEGSEREEIESETIYEAQTEQILSPNESYHTISTQSEPGTVKIVEENIASPADNLSPREIASEIVKTVPVIEAVITQENLAQTSPISEITSDFIQNEQYIKEKPMEPASVQTSPEVPKDITESSIQTDEEIKEVEVKPELQETSTQIELQTTEIDVQTSPETVEPIKEPEKVETIESSTQATPEKIAVTEEEIQTSPEPVVEIPKRESEVQTPVISSQEEFIQTTPPEQITTSEISVEAKPIVEDNALQTSPEPSAPTLEEIERPNVRNVHFADVQTSPVQFKDDSETASTSDQYDIVVEATLTLPSDTSESSTLDKPVPTQRKMKKPEDLIKETIKTYEVSSTNESDSSEDVEVEVKVDGVPIDQKLVSASFVEVERDGKPIKPKRNKSKKQKSNKTPVEKDLFAQFSKQEADSSLDPKDLYSEIARRTPSPIPPEPESDKEAKVTSKVFTDIGEEKVKKIVDKKRNKPKETTVDLSISIPQEEIEVVSYDKVVEQQQPDSFVVESILTETDLKEPFPEEITSTETTTIIQEPKTATAEFLTQEQTVYINDKPLVIDVKPDQTLPKSSIKQKQKSKNKHVTIEEVQSPPLIPDVPITPTSDTILSPPLYTSSIRQPTPREEFMQLTQTAEHTPALLQEVNIRWNQAQALERFKNLQNAQKTTHLSDVLYLATLNEIITDESVEQRINNVEQNLVTLQEAVDKKDVIVIQQTIITTVETITTWLETIEYRIYVNRQQTAEGPSKERVEEFNNLKEEIANIEEKVGQLQTVMQQADNIYSDEDRLRMKSYLDSLQQQVKVIEEVTEENEQLAAGDLKRWEEFIEGVSNVSSIVHQLKRQISDLKESDAAPQTKLNELDKFENENRAQMLKCVNLIASAKSLMRDFPSKEIPKEIYENHELTKQLDQKIMTLRDKTLQLLTLADDYEQTLKDFRQIIEIAEALIDSPISVKNLEHLEDEMQNHRKFFVNLSHCRALLESLEEDLDSETRAQTSELHKNLYDRAKVILDRSSGRFQLMSLAASRWTVLEQGTREEMRWLQVAQQRAPDLNAVTSSDYDRYIDLYQSLAMDIEHHHAKLVHLNNVAHKLQELIYCAGLEQAYDESLEIILKLQDDVQTNLQRLLTFKDNWFTYSLLKDKVGYWLRDAEEQLKRIQVPSESRGQMRQFWVKKTLLF